MLLSFVGFNVRHFCFWSFLTTGLCVLLLPDGICHELSLLSIWIVLLMGTSQQLTGGVLFNLGIRCSSWGMTGSRRCSLAVLDSWHPWWTLSFMTPLWDCFNCCHAVFSGPLLPNSSAKLCRSGCNPSVAGALACPMICGIFFLFFTIPAGLHVKKRVKCQKSMVTTYLCHPIASELS